MEAASMPGTEETTEQPEPGSHVNGEMNGSSAGEEDSTSDSSPPPKRTRLAAAASPLSSPTKGTKSPIVIELSSEADTPVKATRSARRKLLEITKEGSSATAEEHRNGEAEPMDTSSPSKDNHTPTNGDSCAEGGGDESAEDEGDAPPDSDSVAVSECEEVTELTEDSKGDKSRQTDDDDDAEVQEIKSDDDIQEIGASDALDENEKSKNGEVSDEKSTEKTPENTPEKLKKQEERRKSAEAKRQALLNITPRRSSRNIHKNKKYIDGETSDHDEPDIEEILPTDPLAVSVTERVRLAEKDPLSTPSPDKEAAKARRKNTIIVSDTKALAKIAATSKEGKKEPTLVIIDTNSILSGRGPVPMTASASPSLPAALPAQGIYPVMHSPSPIRQSSPTPPKPQPPQVTPKPKGPTGLTDDMYVVEAPSFIVPYVYEKPPREALKEAVEKLSKLLKEEEKKEREEKAKERERKKKEKEAREAEKNKDVEMKDEEGKEGEPKVKDEVVEDKVKGEGVEVSKEGEDAEAKKKKKKRKEGDEEGSDDPDYKAEADSEKESVKEKDSDEEDMEYDSESDSSSVGSGKDRPKTKSYFESPLGKFFMQIGVNLVQEHVQTDLLRMQKRKLQRGGASNNPENQLAVQSLLKNLEQSKENNKPYKFEIQKCKFCNFKTESKLVLAHHLEMPHLRNFMYHCNFCPVALKTNSDILFHMEAEHNVHGRIERAPAFHQCPNCPFEDNQKSKMNRHTISCAKRFRPERNSEPPAEWEPPAKIPRLAKSNNPYRNMQGGPMGIDTRQLSAAASAMQRLPQHPLLPKMPTSVMPSLVPGAMRARGRPAMNPTNRFLPDLKAMPRAIAPSHLRQGGLLYQQSGRQQQVLVPNSYQLAGNQIYQRWTQQQQSPSGLPTMPRLTLMPHGGGTSTVALVPGLSSSSNSITIQSASSKSNTSKMLQQPSISITPLPRQPASSSSASINFASSSAGKHSQLGTGSAGSGGGGKNSFVICEICDGYIKDLEQLRNHMQWIHKVKIHPKMIYNRPPLNCQKCQFRFFTDQGLERHLLGSHGLVTSSMQEASNKGKDGGRCPVCGRVYQWKLLNHVAKDHNMTLKPAHLSYKCTVCTATFGMYKQFENHVYSAHSVVAKRVMDKKAAAAASSPSSSSRGYSAATESLLKPLKINDEITIIPQPAKPSASRGGGTGGNHRKAPCQAADDSGSDTSL